MGETLDYLSYYVLLTVCLPRKVDAWDGNLMVTLMLTFGLGGAITGHAGRLDRDACDLRPLSLCGYPYGYPTLIHGTMLA